MAREYDREFKVEAIRMAAEEGVSARGVEQRLGLSAGIISRWEDPRRWRLSRYRPSG